ncbi:hypothetical protein CIP107509_00372 [Corynebacterium diphtheriae]|nr:hypothetical protein CIP107509_00372 [Corynebacterium diphtheriae]
MVNQTRRFLGAHNGLVQRLQRQHLGPHRIRQRPPDDPPGEYIGHERCVHEAFPGAYIGNVGHPQPIGGQGLKLTIDQVRAKIQALRLTSCDRCPTFALARQACTAHQPGCELTSDVNALASQRVPHLPHPVDTVVFGNERHEYAPRE